MQSRHAGSVARAVQCEAEAVAFIQSASRFGGLMQKALSLFDTSIGKKAVMAVTGLVMFGFVIGHMLGNLQIYLGPEQLNAYASKLRELGPLLWGVRIVLATSIVLHFLMAYSLVLQSWAARPVKYQVRYNTATNYAATTCGSAGR